MTLKKLQKYKQEIKIVQYSFKEQVNEKYKQWEVKLSKVQRKQAYALSSSEQTDLQ